MATDKAGMTPLPRQSTAAPAVPAPSRAGRWLRAAAWQAALTACGFGLLLAVWALLALLSPDLPGPGVTLAALGSMLMHPFYDNGPNDKGIGIQVMISLGRVFGGWLIGSLIAVPLGVALGSSRTLLAVLNPVIQVLRPISPLAWFPLGLLVFKSSPNATLFVIVITSLWPTLINTTFGVAGVPEDYRNVARVFRFSRSQYIFKVLLPYALPHTVTGLRLSMGIAWLVIVAAEMLAGGTGIGYFVFDSYNSLAYPRMISAILIIGVIGLLLDRAFDWLSRRVSYTP